MFKRNRVTGVACTATVLLAGCVSPIHIIRPISGANVDPVTKVQAHFDGNFVPSQPWGVFLNGAPISGFVPPPVPNVTSEAPLLLNLNSIGGTITTHSTCVGTCGYPDETVNFTIPHFEYNDNFTSPARDITRFSPTNVFVAVQFPPNVSIAVTISEDSGGDPKKLRFGNSIGSLQGVGVPLAVTIPGGISSKVDFAIECVGGGPSTYVIRFTAPGGGVGNGAGSGKCL